MPRRSGAGEAAGDESTLRTAAARRGSASRRCWSALILPSDGAKRGQACHPMRMPAALDRVPARSADDGADTSVPAQGVLVVNLGTPDAPTAAAVRRYLGEFLSDRRVVQVPRLLRSEEHTSELQSLMRSSYAVFCLKKKKKNTQL